MKTFIAITNVLTMAVSAATIVLCVRLVIDARKLKRGRR